MTVIEIIKEQRERLNLPLRKVAAAVDVDTSTWSKIEKEERALRAEMIGPVCDLLGLNVKEITIQFWSDKLQEELAGQDYASEILLATKRKLKR